MTTHSRRLRVASWLASLLPLTACAAAPDGAAETASQSAAALTGGTQDATHLAVAYGSNGCVGTFIAPGVVLMSATCFENPQNTRPYNFTSFDAAGNATVHQVAPDVQILQDVNPGTWCASTGRELAVASVYPTLAPEDPYALVAPGSMPAIGASVDVVAFGAPDTGSGGVARRSATATVTQVASPLLDLAPANGALGATDYGAPVFSGGLAVGLFNCPGSGQAIDLQAYDWWIAYQLHSHPAPTCSAPQTSCRQSGTRSVPVVSIACSGGNPIMDLYRWDQTTGTSTRVDSIGASWPVTLEDTPGAGGRDYIVESAGGALELHVDVPECPPLTHHCPVGWVPCDDGCARQCL